MGHKFKLEDNMMYNTKNGSAKTFEFSGENECYAVLAKGGHCGKGYYIPIVVGVQCASQELAVELAKQRGMMKSNRKSVIIDIMKITETEKNFITYINECDRYQHATHHTKELIPNVIDRRIAMEEAVDFENTGDRNKIPMDLVKTANKYSNLHTLQRYLAPSYYGDKLVYPKNINFRDMLDEFFYYSTLQLGIFQKKVGPLSFYYQIYGDKNKLGIRYSNGKMSFKDGCETYTFALPVKAIPHVEEAQKRIEKERLEREQERKKQEEIDKKIIENQKSATERFNERFAKYQQIKNSKLPGSGK